MNRANVLSGIGCLLIGIGVYWLAGDVPATTATDNLGGRFLPRLLAVLMMIASIGLIVTGLMNVEIQGGQASRAGSQPLAREEAPEAPIHLEEEPRIFAGLCWGDLRILAFIAIMTVYTWILPYFGYLGASVPVFAALIYVAGERRPLRVALGAVGITVLLYVLFGVIFSINLPDASLLRQPPA